MAIKNYTTKIDCYQSIGEIQGVLAKNGARKIMIDYDNTGLPVGIAFAIQTQQQMQAFILPVNIVAVIVIISSRLITNISIQIINAQLVENCLVMEHRVIVGIADRL